MRQENGTFLLIERKTQIRRGESNINFGSVNKTS